MGYLGQLVRRKKVHRVLEALAAAPASVTLRVAGRGPEEQRLREVAARHDLTDRVHFDGFVDDLPTWFSRIDALVLPSLEEGWGYVLAEAAAAGRLVLAYRASSVGEVTPEEAGAVLVDPAVCGSLRAGMERLAAMDAAERRDRARRLREHARRSLDLDRMLDRLDTFFRNTLRS